jgi:uncharacterized protein YqgV (UPF0045/DUF77 family)
MVMLTIMIVFTFASIEDINKKSNQKRYVETNCTTLRSFSFQKGEYIYEIQYILKESQITIVTNSTKTRLEYKIKSLIPCIRKTFSNHSKGFYDEIHPQIVLLDVKEMGRHQFPVIFVSIAIILAVIVLVCSIALMECIVLSILEIQKNKATKYEIL